MSRRPEVPSDRKIEATDRSRTGSDDAYAEDRRARLRRGRLVGFALCIPLWALSVVPLAHEFTDGRQGAGRLLVFLAVAAFSLAVAGAIRGAYVVIRKRRFWSPWLFPLAAFVAIVGYAVQSAGEEEVPFPAAASAQARANSDSP